MARYDLKNEIKQSIGLNSTAISTDTTTAGTAIDMKGYNSLVLLLSCSARAAGDFTLLVEDSDDNATFVAVTDTFLSGLESATLVDAANEITRIGYIGKKRYVKASVVSDNSANGTVTVIALQGNGNVPIA